MSCARRAVVSTFLLFWPTLAFAQDAELRGVIKDQSGGSFRRLNHSPGAGDRRTSSDHQ